MNPLDGMIHDIFLYSSAAVEYSGLDFTYFVIAALRSIFPVLPASVSFVVQNLFTLSLSMLLTIDFSKLWFAACCALNAEKLAIVFSGSLDIRLSANAAPKRCVSERVSLFAHTLSIIFCRFSPTRFTFLASCLSQVMLRRLTRVSGVTQPTLLLLRILS